MTDIRWHDVRNSLYKYLYHYNFTEKCPADEILKVKESICYEIELIKADHIIIKR